MAREARLLHAFLDFAESLAATTAPSDIAIDLTQRVAGLFAVDAAVVLGEAGGSLRAVAWSSEPGQRLAELETEHAEGPGHDAIRAVGCIIATDRDDALLARWPRFAPEAARIGLRSFAAVPLRRSGAALGALALGATSPEALAPDDVAVVQGLADVTALAIDEARAARHARVVAEQLRTALDARVVIEQAKGVVAHRARVSVDEAFVGLRRYARGRHQLLTDVARRVVEGELDPEAVAHARAR
jgi:GAF domain-containing protein